MQVLDSQRRISTEQVMDGQLKYVAESVTLNAYEQVVHASDAAEAVVVTLPAVAEAVGKIYTVYTTDDSGTNGVDVVTQGDELYSTTEIDPGVPTTLDVSSAVAIDTAGDFLCLYSNGISWILLAHMIA